MSNTKTQIKVGGLTLDCNKNAIKRKTLTLTLSNKAEFEKAIAIAEWSDSLEKFGLGVIFKPTVRIGSQIFRPDFYLQQADAFVMIKPTAYDGIDEEYDEEIEKLAFATERNIVVGYTDGRFKVADYFFYKGKIASGEWEQSEADA